MEEPVGQVTVDLTLVRTVGVAEKRERPIRGHDRLPTRLDLFEGLIPANRLELTRPFGPCPTQRGPDAFRRVNELGVPIDLRAGKTSSEGLLRIAGELDQPVVINLRQQGTHARTIMGACHSDRLHRVFSSVPAGVANETPASRV